QHSKNKSASVSSESNTIAISRIYDLAKKFVNGNLVKKNYNKAIQWFHKAAYLGSIDAFFDLGQIYENDLGQGRDLFIALGFYLEAGTRGHREAQRKLEDMYRYGDGVQIDLDKAKEWSDRAFEQGSVKEAFELGLKYFEGEPKGSNQDYARAIRWFTKAAEKGHLQSLNFLGVMYENGLVDGHGISDIEKNNKNSNGSDNDTNQIQIQYLNKAKE